MTLSAAILTISDGCFQGRREDLSGQALQDAVEAAGWRVAERQVAPDVVEKIRDWLVEWSNDDRIDLIVSTGGTGLGPRDVTPEAVEPLLERQVPGLAEMMRQRGLEKTDYAALSRSLAGVRSQTLVLCLPGSPKGAVESFQAVAGLIPHAVDLVQGRTKHSKKTFG